MSRIADNESLNNIQYLVSQPSVRRIARSVLPGSGFTIVELLIVIVIIGILAAIVIVAYSGITNRANDSAVQSDLSDMAKRLEIARIDNGGSYPFPPSTNANIHITKAAYKDVNNLYYCYDSAADKYAVLAMSVSGQTFNITNGSVSSGAPYGYSGQHTCDILQASITWGAAGTSSLGHTGGTTTWASWAQ